MIRSMGLKIGGDKELQDHLRHMLGMPNLSDEVFNDAYKNQGPGAIDPNDAPVNNKGAAAQRKPDDSIDNVLEQSGSEYTGQ
ncbi:MAG: hypothetical protein RR461_12010 [Angelakisella sp.]